ncbi:hypothetical protein HK104_011339 [Borealophlyctis nickersoniae]|nr:hypothetical protein HK104_011339 [Borealophlyctis nickersoniae]
MNFYFKSAQQARKVPYIPNAGSFSSATTQREDYPAWPVVSGPQKKERPQWISTSGDFEGTTTNKSDYKEFGVQPRYQRKPQEYVKPDTTFDGVSTQANDYRSWPVPPRPTGRQCPPYLPPPDDREFKSTTSATYIGHQLPKTASMAPRPMIPPATKFEGTTTTSEAFQKWSIPPRETKPKAAYTPNKSPLESHTTCKRYIADRRALALEITRFVLADGDTFQPKTAERFFRPQPVYHANEAKFEGTSTHRTDFQGTGKVQREADFRPRATYLPHADDRDFLTTTRAQHSPKQIPHCPAADWIPLERERHSDGHMYLAESSRPAVASIQSSQGVPIHAS